MRARRRLVPLVTAAAVTLPAATAHAQGAGDDQYQDPFGNTKSSSPKSQTHHQIAQAQSSPGLSQSPPGSSAPASTQTTAPSTSAPAAAAAPAATALPRTGMDLPGTALLGFGLLLSGVGLRLRTLDESDY